jgi:O-antigen/teichoic acid export membrane protein
MEEANPIKNFSYVGLGRIITIGLQAGFYLLLAALMDPEVYGELSVILALAATFSTISLFGLNLSLQVYRAKNNIEISGQIITLFIILTTIASIILIPIDYVAAFLCASLSFFAMAQYDLLGLKQYKKYMIYSALKSGTFFVIPLLLFFVFDITGIVVGMAISNLIGSVSFFKSLTVKKFFGLKNYYKVLVHNFGVFTGSALPNMVDKLLIAPLFGLFIVGIYQFNLQILIALSILPGILSQYLVSEEASGVRHKKLSYLVVLSSIPIVGIAIILVPILVPILYPNYTEGIESLQIMIISIIPQSIGVIFSSKLLAKESTKIGFTAIVRIGSLLILLAILGQFYGLVGLAIAVLISLSANTLYLYVLYMTSTKQNTIH